MNNSERNSYVRQQIVKALLSLIGEKDLQEISITELCQTAGVGRASFYRNYRDREDVLKQECERLIQEWGKEFESDPHSSPDNVLASLFSHYRKHKDFYLAIVHNGCGRFVFAAIDQRVGAKPEMENRTAYGQAFFAYGLYGWITEWMKRGMQESGEEMQRQIRSGAHEEKK